MTPLAPLARFRREVRGALRVATVLVIAIAVAQFVIAQVAQDSATFNLGPATVKILAIASGVLTLIANFLPSIFGNESPAAPAVKP